MRFQSSVLLRALLCLFFSTPPFFCGASVSHNTTNVTASTTEGIKTDPRSESPTTTPPGTDNTEAQISTTIKSMSSGPPVPAKPTVRPEVSPTTSPPTSSSAVSTGVVLFLFVCFLILLFFCAYNWYVRNGRPSIAEIRRILAEYARNAWATIVTHLRSSSKDEEEEEEDEEKEAGTKVAEEDTNQGRDVDDGDSDSSDYSNMEGFPISKKNEENERDDDMSSVELKDEKMEREKDDLTVL